MITLPRRAVTRFFIPLIDVLILLFCIFLLMPIAEEGAAKAAGEEKLSPGEAMRLRQELDRLRTQIALLERTRESPRTQELLDEVQRLRQQAQRSVTDRLVIRTLQVDPQNGELVYYDPERLVVRDQKDALDLADRDRQTVAGTGRELYYLVLVPREWGKGLALRPTRDDFDRVERWLKDVPHGWDVPQRGRPGGGKLR